MHIFQDKWFWEVFDVFMNIFVSGLFFWLINQLLNPRFNSKVVRFFSSSVATLVLAFIYTLDSEYRIFGKFEAIITILVLFVYSYYFLKGNGLIDNLVMVIFARQLMSFCASGGYMLISIVTKTEIHRLVTMWNFRRFMIHVVTMALYMIGAILFSKFHKNIKNMKIHLKFHQWILFACSFLLTTLVNDSFLYLAMESNMHQGLIFFSIFSVWGIFTSICLLLTMILHLGQSTMEKRLISQREEYERRQIITFAENLEGIRKTRKDIIDNLSPVVQSLHELHYDEARELIVDICGKIEQDSEDYWGECDLTIDAIVNMRAKICSDNHIKLDVQYKIHYGMISRNFCAGDIAVIIGNLLDNAIEACQKLPEDNRFIGIELIERPNELMIVIKNSIDQSVLSDNHDLQTTKADNIIHGFGKRIIENKLSELGGYMRYKEEENEFIACVWLPWKGKSFIWEEKKYC